MIAGRYSLDRELGRGGTGAVWLGCDELLGRPVALKRIGVLPGADHTDVARAEREARLSARLNHPHVVAVFDVVADTRADALAGTLDSPSSLEAAPEDWWLVMEYVEGQTLAELVHDRGKLAPDEAAAILWQVADGLAAAHAEGITHRDVKPSNVLVDSDGNAKLTDFGIARVVTDPSLTQTGLMTGSPAYLAPEIASGGRGDAASDVWSLGATTYHVLAGRPPYEIGDHVLGALYRIVNDDPPRLADAGWLAPLLEGTMVKDPAQRWSMQQVRAFLAPAAGSAPVAPVALPVPEEGVDGHTRVLTAVHSPAPYAEPAPIAPPTDAPDAPEEGRPSWRRSSVVLAALGVAAVLVLAAVVASSLTRGGTKHDSRASGTPPSTAKAAVAKPTARGMEAFIRRYVTTVADDPKAAWGMLTPKFQRESGGLDRYLRFWDSATDGRVLSVTADPRTLSVSYYVHFDHFDNGPGPTVLDLTFHNGRYLIDGEHTKGFVPAG